MLKHYQTAFYIVSKFIPTYTAYIVFDIETLPNIIFYCRLSPTSPGTNRSLSMPEPRSPRVPFPFETRSSSMPITAASIAAQKLDEYLQRAVASYDDTPQAQINLGHSSNRGASLLSHISQLGGTPFPLSRDSATIKPSEVRKAGGKVTATGGLISVKNEDKHTLSTTGAKRAKLDDTAQVTCKLRLTERHQGNDLSNTGKTNHPNKDGKSSPADVSSSYARNRYLFERHLKSERERKEAEVRSRSTDRAVTSLVAKDLKSLNVVTQFQEKSKRSAFVAADNSALQSSSSAQSVSSYNEANVSQASESVTNSSKTLVALDKRLHPQQFSFAVNEKVQANLVHLPNSQRQPRPSPLVPASQLGVRASQVSSQTRTGLPASQISSQTRTGLQVESNSSARVSVARSSRQQELNTEIDTPFPSADPVMLNDEFGAVPSHISYDNIYNANSPLSRPNVGLSELFEDSGFDYVSNFLNPNQNLNRSNTASRDSASTNLMNEGRIMLGDNSSAFDLVTDSNRSKTLRFDVQDFETSGLRSLSKSGFSNKSSLLTRLRQGASHTVTSASAVDETETEGVSHSKNRMGKPSAVNRTSCTATVSRPDHEDQNNDKPEKAVVKSMRLPQKSETEKKIQPPKPGGIKRAGPYLLGKNYLRSFKTNPGEITITWCSLLINGQLLKKIICFLEKILTRRAPTVLQIRRRNRDNLGIIIHISP